MPLRAVGTLAGPLTGALDGRASFAHHLIVGWSVDAAISDAELAAGAASDGSSAVLPDATGFNYIYIWRSDTDGGDPAAVSVAGTAGWRNNLGVAVAREYDGVPGQLLVTINTQDAGLLSGETVTVT